MSDLETIDAQVAQVREHVGSLPMLLLFRLLDLIQEQYRSRLEVAPIDAVADIQAAIKQIKALRGALVDPSRHGRPLI